MNTVSQLIRALTVLLLGMPFIGSTQPAAGQDCSLPSNLVPFVVVGTPVSVTPVQLPEIPAGHFVQAGLHEGWCVQYDTMIAPGITYHGGLYHSQSPLPPQLQNIPWDKINYLLNHKQGSIWDVQYAIWHVLGQAPNPPSNTPMTQMIDAARNQGPGFVPQDGQLVAIIVEPQEGVQRLIIEAIYDSRCLDSTPPEVHILAPSFGLQITSAQTIPITAPATDPFGVTAVMFYDGANLLGTVTNEPFVFFWPVTANDNGWHTLSAVAYDYAGNAATSSMVAVQVNINPAPGRLSCARLSPKLCRINFSGAPGRAYLVRYSTDLVTWFPIDTAIEISPGRYQLDHLQPTPLPQAFYQAQLQ